MSYFPPTPEMIALDIANAHRLADALTICVLYDYTGKELRFIEVSRVPSSGDAIPYRRRARPDLGIPYAVSVLLLSKEEWVDVQAGKLALPDGWILSTFRRV